VGISLIERSSLRVYAGFLAPIVSRPALAVEALVRNGVLDHDDLKFGIRSPMTQRSRQQSRVPPHDFRPDANAAYEKTYIARIQRLPDSSILPKIALGGPIPVLVGEGVIGPDIHTALRPESAVSDIALHVPSLQKHVLASLAILSVQIGSAGGLNAIEHLAR
jgi:hypothetical protein